MSAVNRRYAEMFLHSYRCQRYIYQLREGPGRHTRCCRQASPQSLFRTFGPGDSSCVASEAWRSRDVCDVGLVAFLVICLAKNRQANPRVPKLFYGVATCICSYQYLWDLKIDRSKVDVQLYGRFADHGRRREPSISGNFKYHAAQ